MRIDVPEVKGPRSWTAPGDAKPPPPPKPPREPLRRAKAWRRMLDEGVYPHQSALARGEGVTAAAVSLGLRKLREASVAAPPSAAANREGFAFAAALGPSASARDSG